MATQEARHEAEEFFYQRAGWSYDPKTQTPEQGRRECARQLAEAEEWADEQGFKFLWADDWGIDHQQEFDCYDDGEPQTCEYCCLVDDSEGLTDVRASLGCIDDANDNYRRVIQAELALEVMTNMQEVK